MRIRQINFETGLYLLAFTLALFFRLYNLGAAPLSDFEAYWALQAMQIASPLQGSEPLAFGPQPAYIFLTGVLFTLFKSTNFLARLWPALAGAFLVLTPYAIRHKFGRAAALILAFGLAFDPGQVASSRLAGGPMMAIGFTIIALAFVYTGKALFGGFVFGLALLNGPDVIVGLISLSLTWVGFRFGRPSTAVPSDPPAKKPVPQWNQILIGAGISILLIGTLFFRYPQGLSAWVGTLPTYLAGWLNPSGIPLWRLVAALLVFAPLTCLLSMFTLVRWLFPRTQQQEAHSELSALALLWAIFTLIFVLLYPARQVADLAWVLLPLWALAAREAIHFIPKDSLQPISLAQACLIFILAALCINILISTGGFAGSAINILGGSTQISNLLLRLILLFGIIGLGVLSTILVYLGWDRKVSQDGFVLGLLAVLGVYTISALWGATQLRANNPEELWGPPPATGQADLLLNTIEGLSDWNTGFLNEIDVLSSVETPSLRWALRDFPKARFFPVIPSGELPSIVITRQEVTPPSLTATYRGHDFVWWSSPGWPGALPPDFISWLIFRQAPTIDEKIILWARSDIFQGGGNE